MSSERSLGQDRLTPRSKPSTAVTYDVVMKRLVTAVLALGLGVLSTACGHPDVQLVVRSFQVEECSPNQQMLLVLCCGRAERRHRDGVGPLCHAL